MKLSNLMSKLDEFAPLRLTESWDNCGLIAGDMNDEVNGVLMAMDVTDDVLDYALSNKYNVIFAHHPMIFKSMKSFNKDEKRAKLLRKAFINDLNILAWHTPLDLCNHGTHYALGNIIGLESSEIIKPITYEKYYKIISFVPKDHIEIVASAITQAGAGRYGEYDSCTFRQSGVGTFRPNEFANPYIGENGKLEYVDEIKIESIVKESHLKDVINALKEAHPYEEVAYDVVEIENLKKIYGHGRSGHIKKTTLRELVKSLKEKLKCPGIQYYGLDEMCIEKVAFCPGGGEDLISSIKGVDVYISSDIRSTKVLDIMDKDIAVIDLGHYYSERPVLFEVERFLKNQLIDVKLEICPFEMDNGSKVKFF